MELEEFLGTLCDDCKAKAKKYMLELLGE